MSIKNDIKSTIRVALVELNTMFYSPVAWLVLIIFSIQIGYSFTDIFTKQMHNLELNYSVYNLTDMIFSQNRGILYPIVRNLYLYLPLITMGLMSREYQSGSIRLLYSSPIKNASIILGKFISMMIYGLCLITILAVIFIFCLFTIENFDYKPVLVGILGIYLLILSYSAIGLFMSSLTKYQVISAIGTLVILASLNYISSLGQSYAIIRDLTYWMSIGGRVQSFINGLIASSDLIYFIIVISLFLTLSIFKINTEKTVMSLKSKLMKIFLILFVTFSLGYIITIPQLKMYDDATYSKLNTISKSSQKILKQIEGPITIITYANLFAEDFHLALPKNRKYDIGRFENYIRFKKDINMEYVLYYDIPLYSDRAQAYNKKNMYEMAKEQCSLYKIDFNMVLSPEEFKKKYLDLSGEGNKFLRILRLKDGREAILRTFNDASKYPEEKEITTALRRLVSSSQKVAFSIGHGERDINNYGSMGYYSFAKNKWFRHSLMNQGFDSEQIDIEKQDIPNDIDILVISDLKKAFSAQALNKINSYINDGGNLYILGEYGRSDNMNKVMENIGVRFESGLIVNESKRISPVITIARYDDDAAKMFFDYTILHKYKYPVSMPTCLAIDYSGVKDFSVIPVLLSRKDAWIEKETTDFVDGKFIFNESAGEKKNTYTTLIKMKRNINNKEQRIVISGDSDFISNEELTSRRPGLDYQNFNMIIGTFRWLSNDKYPIDTRREDPIDNALTIAYSNRSMVNWMFLFIIPIIIIGLGAFIIIKRQIK